MIGAVGELDYFSAHIRLREPDKSKDKADSNKHLPSLGGMKRLRYRAKQGRSFPLTKGSARINKDQYNLADPTPESVIGELKQHGRSEFNYSTTATKSNWEPRGVLQPEQKIEDSAKSRIFGFVDVFRSKLSKSTMDPWNPFASVTMGEEPFNFLRALCGNFYVFSFPFFSDGVIAGATAGVVVETVLYPIDTIKTRLQAS
ncbi:hypothetical protein GW17_00017260 [Ensete ventricosum]|nr:hypothetical protein GW17_00017260 [Ensete ventricosum]